MAVRKILFFHDFHVIDHRENKAFFCRESFRVQLRFPHLLVWRDLELDASFWKIRAVIAVRLIPKPTFFHKISDTALAALLCMLPQIVCACILGDKSIWIIFRCIENLSERLPYHALPIGLDAFRTRLIIFLHAITPFLSFY